MQHLSILSSPLCYTDFTRVVVTSSFLFYYQSIVIKLQFALSSSVFLSVPECEHVVQELKLDKYKRNRGSKYLEYILLAAELTH